MSLNPVDGGLHRLKNDSHDVAKVTLTVPPGDELEVSGTVAAQLADQANFRDPADVPAPGPQVVLDANGEVDFEASPPEALKILGLAPPVVEGTPKPKKRTSKTKADPA